MVASTVDADIERIGNTLDATIGNAVDAYMNRKEKLIERNLLKLQGEFFKTLALMTINAANAPNLGEYTPTWKPLDPGYTARKQKRGKGFYNFRGGLKRSLMASKATTSLGTPVVMTDAYAQSPAGKARYTYTNGTARRDSGSIVAKGKYEVKRVFSIDLYPKVMEDIDEDMPFGNYFSKNIAVKMTNYRGQQDRPILANFMNWWLDVKAKQIVMKALNG